MRQRERDGPIVEEVDPQGEVLGVPWVIIETVG
jgi:hypothetical protein